MPGRQLDASLPRLGVCDVVLRCLGLGHDSAKNSLIPACECPQHSCQLIVTIVLLASLYAPPAVSQSPLSTCPPDRSSWIAQRSSAPCTGRRSSRSSSGRQPCCRGLRTRPPRRRGCTGPWLGRPASLRRCCWCCCWSVTSARRCVCASQPLRHSCLCRRAQPILHLRSMHLRLCSSHGCVLARKQRHVWLRWVGSDRSQCSSRQSLPAWSLQTLLCAFSARETSAQQLPQEGLRRLWRRRRLHLPWRRQKLRYMRQRQRLQQVQVQRQARMRLRELRRSTLSPSGRTETFVTAAGRSSRLAGTSARFSTGFAI